MLIVVTVLTECNVLQSDNLFYSSSSWQGRPRRIVV